MRIKILVTAVATCQVLAAQSKDDLARDIAALQITPAEKAKLFGSLGILLL